MAINKQNIANYILEMSKQICYNKYKIKIVCKLRRIRVERLDSILLGCDLLQDKNC